MLRAVIIDDESNGVRSLELLLEHFITDVKVVATSTSAIKGVEMIDNYCPEIVFLDINMPHLNGFELLEKLEFRGFHLIFTTAHEEYAIQAIRKQAVDYLLKPIGTGDLATAIERIKRKRNEAEKVPDVVTALRDALNKEQSRIAIHQRSGIEYVNANDIILVEADSNYSNIMMRDEKMILVSRPLKEYEAILCREPNFIRIHNSYIINVNYVTRYLKEEGGQIVINNKKQIPVSKQKKDEFFKMVNFKADGNFL